LVDDPKLGRPVFKFEIAHAISSRIARLELNV
jgi:hypothetical protein